jgi:hypothetical protein
MTLYSQCPTVTRTRLRLLAYTTPIRQPNTNTPMVSLVEYPCIKEKSTLDTTMAKDALMPRADCSREKMKPR